MRILKKVRKMSNYLIASYSLRIKKIYDDIKETIPKKLNGSMLQNRKNVTKFIIPYVQKAYVQGVRFAEAYSGKKVKAKISDKDKKALFEEFNIKMIFAEKVYKIKMENLRKLAKLQKKRIDLKNGSQEMIINTEYVNGIKKAINNLILNAGQKGQFQVWE